MGTAHLSGPIHGAMTLQSCVRTVDVCFVVADRDVSALVVPVSATRCAGGDDVIEP